jgi:transcriptional regulator of acetoin/glycerol metabolism
MLAEGEWVDSNDFPEYMLAAKPQAHARSGALTMAQVERQHAMEVLAECEGNRVRAAEMLGISRATLYRLLAKPAAAGG